MPELTKKAPARNLHTSCHGILLNMLALVHMHCLSHSSPGRGAPASRAAKLRVATDLTQRDISLCALRDAREVKHVFPALALCVIRPFLGQMIIVFLAHRETSVVKIARRFQTG